MNEKRRTDNEKRRTTNEKRRTEVALRKEPEWELAILKKTPAELRELYSQACVLELRECDRITTPTGGQLLFSVPGPAGDTLQPTLTGIVIWVQDRRAYWSVSGSGSPPDCASADGLRGEGNPGGVCARCPLSKFPDGGGAPPCRHTMDVVFIGKDDLLPTIYRVAPTGTQAVKRYMHALIKGGWRLWDVVTVISLERETGRGGIVYSKPVFTKARTIDPAQHTRMREIVTALGFGVRSASAASPAPADAPAAPEEDIPAHATLDLTADADVPPPVPPEDNDIPF